jgi:phytoene/squalene synthetase
VFGVDTLERMAQSERICAGLQVVEHLQDVAEDHSRGRVYLPRRDMERFGCTDADLGAPQASAALRALVAFEAARAYRLLDEGVPLVRTVPLRPRIALASFVAGGRAALDALARASYDVCSHTNAPRRRLDFGKAFANAVVGR